MYIPYYDIYVSSKGYGTGTNEWGSHLTTLIIIQMSDVFLSYHLWAGDTLGMLVTQLKQKQELSL